MAFKDNLVKQKDGSYVLKSKTKKAKKKGVCIECGENASVRDLLFEYNASDVIMVRNYIEDHLVKYPNHHTATLGSALWKIASIIVLMFVFYYNEQSVVNQNEFAEFYIEDYLTFNTTYEIADHSDYSFENSNFSNSYESVSIDDTIELRLYGESPTNLNLFDDE